MAKITVEFDTVEKTMVVTKDGAVVENVDTVEFWKSFDNDEKFRVGLTTIEHDEDQKMNTVTRVFADECPDGRVEEQLTPLQAAVANYMNPTV